MSLSESLAEMIVISATLISGLSLICFVIVKLGRRK